MKPLVLNHPGYAWWGEECEEPNLERASWDAANMQEDAVIEGIDGPLVGKKIEETLKTLTPREYRVLRLKYWHNMSYREIGQTNNTQQKGEKV